MWRHTKLNIQIRNNVWVLSDFKSCLCLKSSDSHSYTWFGSFTRVPWFIHARDSTHWHVWHDSCICIMYLIHIRSLALDVRDNTHLQFQVFVTIPIHTHIRSLALHVCEWVLSQKWVLYTSVSRVTSYTSVSGVTWHVCRYPFTHVTRLTDVYDMTRPSVWLINHP